MKKYRLIKEYPGSPELGIEVEKESNSKSSSSYFYRSGDRRICVLNDHVEDNPEYWEEIIEETYGFLVFTRDRPFINSWEVFTLKEHKTRKDYSAEECAFLFKTEEEAFKFVLYNKPCISIHEILERFGYSQEFGRRNISFQGTEDSLKEIVNNKL